jgi:4-hydroxybenzoate polyprenyltransferase
MSGLRAYGRMIKVSHTIFSMPFALSAVLLASREAAVTWLDVVLIVLCVLMARSSAMGFNRIVDREIDGANPRTANREVPSGTISVASAWIWTLASAALFHVFAAMLGSLTLLLAPVALVVLWGYSLSKRWTFLCHLILGLALALAPIAAWIAITDGMSVTALLLGLAVGTWVSGFDIIYSCQDAEFDRKNDLSSLPAALGVGPALVISALLHVVTFAALCALPYWAPMGVFYWVGVVAIGGVLVWEHAIVRPTDLSRVNKAFFDLNGYISLVFFAGVALS